MIRQIIRSVTFTAPVSRLQKQLSRIAVARQAKFRNQGIKQELDKDQITTPSPLTSRSEGSSNRAEDDKKGDEKKARKNSSKKSSCEKRDSKKGNSGDYEVYCHDKGCREVEVLKQ